MLADDGTPGQDVFQLVQDAQPHGRGHLVELGVDTHALDALGIDDAEVDHAPDALGELVVFGDDRPAFDGVEQLGGVEADGGDVAPLQHGAAFVEGAKGMGTVIDDLQAVAIGDLLQPTDIAGVAEHVGGDDGRGIGLDGCFDVGRIQVPGLRVDVGEDRPDPLPVQGAGGGDEAEGCGDGAAGQAQSAVGDLQGQGTVVDQDDVSDP